jgi:ATP-dependent DNA helicase DinG
VSSWRLLDLTTDIVSFLDRENLLDELLHQRVHELNVATNAFTDGVGKWLEGPESRLELSELYAKPGVQDAMLDLQQDVSRLLDRIADHLESMMDRSDVVPRLVERARELNQEFTMLVEQEAADLVYIIERRGRGVFLHGYPVDLQPIFQQLLYRTCKTQVFTSATLTTDHNFSFFKRRMGMPSDTAELQLSPVFDYMNQSILYVPEDLPEPQDPRYIDRVAPTIEALIRITDGKAFVLFTSYRNMYRAFELLGPRIRQQVLLQGERSRAALLEDFRRDRDSVLFATSSFWEGVDVQGEALSLVIIDKLPFASPADPLVRARLKHIEDRGGNAFVEYQVPQAAIALKQGVGRLIRHRNDIGIIAVLDARIMNARYARRFLDTIPRTRRTRDLELVRRWWASKKGPAEE